MCSAGIQGREDVRLQLSVKGGREELRAGYGEMFPSVAARLVHHDGPLVRLKAWPNKPVEAFSVVRGRPWDDSGPFDLQFGRLLLEFPQVFQVFGLVLCPFDEVVVLVGAARLQDVQVVVPVTSSIDVDELLVVRGKLNSNAALGFAPIFLAGLARRGAGAISRRRVRALVMVKVAVSKGQGVRTTGRVASFDSRQPPLFWLGMNTVFPDSVIPVLLC